MSHQLTSDKTLAHLETIKPDESDWRMPSSGPDTERDNLEGSNRKELGSMIALFGAVGASIYAVNSNRKTMGAHKRVLNFSACIAFGGL